MKRLILDTSVYGKLAEESEVVDIILKEVPQKFVVYGNEIIRKELRETPKHVRRKGRNVRILLLNIYSKLIRDHELKLNKLIKTLSSDYFKEYARQGGAVSSRKLKNDFLIIAAATIHNLDVVISDDERTMFSPRSVKAYKIVNQNYGLRNPEFLIYRRFKENLKHQEDLPV